MQTTKQHIVFLTPGFAASEEDSTTIPALQVYLKQLKEELPQTKMTLLSFQFPFTSKSYTWNGIEVIPLNGKNQRFKKLWTWHKALRILKKIHHKNPITTLHSFWVGECSKLGEQFSKKHNINHIITVMGQDARLKNNYTKLLLNTSAKIVTLSKNHKTELQKNHQLNATIIPWSLDTNSFPELQTNTIDILGIGSLNKVKNYATFLAVIKQLTKTHPNLRVEIIGEGILRSTLERKITDLDLTKNVTIIGELPREKVFQKMAQARILLHTSQYESFGFVFLEALYSGMQVVSFNVGIAKPIPEWHICNTEKDFIKACKKELNKPNPDKKRLILKETESTISSYLKLYDE